MLLSVISHHHPLAVGNVTSDSRLVHRAHGTGAFLILTLFAGALTAALFGLGFRKHFTGALGLGAILLSVACGELGPLWGGRVGALCMGSRPVVLSTTPFLWPQTSPRTL